ncbi:hypothetical protein [Nocardioides speluncae]|uniref:hypothetical protein n=1 Tax=Nocardioides speluncae TaxID=2670337 RepID=UPI000D69394A|nr:hypothetical protein [Nocardioides speluncae]
MARYQVVVAHRSMTCAKPRTLDVRACDPAEAFQCARLRLTALGDTHDIAGLTIRRRGHRHRITYPWPAAGGGDGGTAGVREPRRPLPSPPTLRIAI